MRVSRGKTSLVDEALLKSNASVENASPLDGQILHSAVVISLSSVWQAVLLLARITRALKWSVSVGVSFV